MEKCDSPPAAAQQQCSSLTFESFDLWPDTVHLNLGQYFSLKDWLNLRLISKAWCQRICYLSRIWSLHKPSLKFNNDYNLQINLNKQLHYDSVNTLTIQGTKADNKFYQPLGSGLNFFVDPDYCCYYPRFEKLVLDFWNSNEGNFVHLIKEHCCTSAKSIAISSTCDNLIESSSFTDLHFRDVETLDAVITFDCKYGKDYNNRHLFNSEEDDEGDSNFTKSLNHANNVITLLRSSRFDKLEDFKLIAHLQFDILDSDSSSDSSESNSDSDSSSDSESDSDRDFVNDFEVEEPRFSCSKSKESNSKSSQLRKMFRTLESVLSAFLTTHGQQIKKFSSSFGHIMSYDISRYIKFLKLLPNLKELFVCFCDIFYFLDMLSIGEATEYHGILPNVTHLNYWVQDDDEMLEKFFKLLLHMVNPSKLTSLILNPEIRTKFLTWLCTSSSSNRFISLQHLELPIIRSSASEEELETPLYKWFIKMTPNLVSLELELVFKYQCYFEMEVAEIGELELAEQLRYQLPSLTKLTLKLLVHMWMPEVMCLWFFAITPNLEEFTMELDFRAKKLKKLLNVTQMFNCIKEFKKLKTFKALYMNAADDVKPKSGDCADVQVAVLVLEALVDLGAGGDGGAVEEAQAAEAQILQLETASPRTSKDEIILDLEENCKKSGGKYSWKTCRHVSEAKYYTGGAEGDVYVGFQINVTETTK